MHLYMRTALRSCLLFVDHTLWCSELTSGSALRLSLLSGLKGPHVLLTMEPESCAMHMTMCKASTLPTNCTMSPPPQYLNLVIKPKAEIK